MFKLAAGIRNYFITDFEVNIQFSIIIEYKLSHGMFANAGQSM